MAELSASKRLVTRCQFNALHGQIGGQAVYLGQPCGVCVGKLLGDAPVDKEAGEGLGMKISCARPFVAPRAYAAPGRRGFVAPRWHEGQAAAAAIVSQAFKASAVYISAGPPPM